MGHISDRPYVREPKEYESSVREHFLLFGSVDECVEHVRDEIGIDYLGLSFSVGGLAQEKALRSTELFMTEVVPRVEPAARGLR